MHTLDLVNPENIPAHYTTAGNVLMPNYIYADDGFGNLVFTLDMCEFHFRPISHLHYFGEF